MHLACCGLAPEATEKEWVATAGDNDRLKQGMTKLYALFKDAPVLGSLINPRAAGSDLLEADFNELQPLLEKALERETKDDTAHEMTDQGGGNSRWPVHARRHQRSLPWKTQTGQSAQRLLRALSLRRKDRTRDVFH